MKRSTLIKTIFSLLFIFLISYLIIKNWQGRSKKETAIPVTVAVAQEQDVMITTHAIGNVQAYATVNVKSLVDGQLLKVGFQEGQMVQVNQLLFSIDPRPFQVALEQAQANLNRDIASLETAQLAFKRNAALIEKGYIARQDYDQIRNNAKSLAATVKADESAVANAKLQLGYSTIYSPISGRTGNLLVKPGNLVKANDTNPLVVINQLQPIYVVFSLPENKLPLIREARKKAPVMVTVHVNKDLQEKTLKGPITFIDNTIDVTTGMIQLKATFPNEDLMLWPGQFVDVHINLYQIKNAIIIPSLAVQAGATGNFVFIIKKTPKGNHAFVQPIQLGPEIKENSVITQGLLPGDVVVTAGQLRLTNGKLVEIVKS